MTKAITLIMTTIRAPLTVERASDGPLAEKGCRSLVGDHSSEAISGVGNFAPQDSNLERQSMIHSHGRQQSQSTPRFASNG